MNEFEAQIKGIADRLAADGVFPSVAAIRAKIPGPPARIPSGNMIGQARARLIKQGLIDASYDRSGAVSRSWDKRRSGGGPAADPKPRYLGPLADELAADARRRRAMKGGKPR